jgi:Nuclease-related domain
MKSPWRVKYEGMCSRCGTSLPAGNVAVYERATRTIHCVECPPAGGGVELPDPEPESGIAGGSALREYERRRAGREVRVRDRFGNRLGGVVLALTSEPQSTLAWAIGAKGEEKLARALEGIAGLRNIDHIAIAPAGVFVVDAKRYEGLIQIRDGGNFFRSDQRLYVGRRDCSALADGLGWQVETVLTVLRDGGADPLPPVTPVLCFVDGEWPLLRAPSSFRGVRLEGTRSIRKLLTAHDALDPAAIDRLAQVVGAGLPPKQWAAGSS